jgi:hypothetical protein
MAPAAGASTHHERASNQLIVMDAATNMVLHESSGS